MHKRGLSTTITILVIILLAITSTITIYGVTKLSINEAGTSADLQQKCFFAEAKPISCTYNSDNISLKVQVVRGEVDSIIGIIEFKNKEIKTERKNIDNVIINFSISRTSSQIPKIGKASTIVSDEEGKIYVCPESPISISCINNINDIDNPFQPPIPTTSQCDDGIDNDHDSLIDFPADPGCTNRLDNDEFNQPPATPQCDDGIDNDHDGFIDLQDPGCINETDNTETLDGEYQGFTIAELKQKFDNYFTTKYTPQIIQSGSYLGGPYHSEPFVAGLISIYEATQNDSYINNSLTAIENLISTQMNDVNGDGFNEFQYGIVPGNCITTYNATVNSCSCLDMERGVRQFARLARVIKNDPVLNSKFGIRADNLIKMIKKDIINNPLCKNRYLSNFTNGDAPVYHIISHGALILTELYLIEGNQTYKDIATAKAQSLQNNLLSQSTDPKALAWGTTFCVDLNYTYPDCYYVNVPDKPACRDSMRNRYCSPADTSHAENFVFVAIEFYRAGIVFKKEDINALAYTFMNKMWDGNISDPKVYDFIDGKLEALGGKYGQLVMGGNIAPGWVGLGAFNNELQKVVENRESSSIQDNPNYGWTNKMAYYGELARNLVSEDCQYTNNAKEICDGIDNDCDGSKNENC